jgi:hypothetical protein
VGEMPSLAGTARNQFERYAWDTAIFARMNSDLEFFVERKRWREANKVAVKLDSLLATWRPTLPVN